MDLFRKMSVVDQSSNTLRECHLVKYARKEYPTIRIGTLEYFRSLEGERADTLDGRVKGLTFKGPSAAMRWQEFERTMRDSSIKIVARDGIQFGPTGSLTDDKHRACPNMFVFCCSIEFGAFPNAERVQHFDATTHAVIDDPERLRTHVEDYLFENAHSKDGKILNRGSHYVKSWHAPVRYKDRTPAEIDSEINNLDLFVFQKDVRFRIEQEYRFAWAFFESGTDTQIWVQYDAVDMPVTWTEGVAHVSI